VPIVAIKGNVVRHRGKGLHRHAGKTETSLRIVLLPRFVVDVLTGSPLAWTGRSRVTRSARPQRRSGTTQAC
jgi:hypothetical protein